MKKASESKKKAPAGFNPKDALSFDFVTDAVRAARVAAVAGKRLVVDLFYKDVRGLPREESLAALKDFMGRSVRRREAGAVICAPAHLVITKNIEIPSQDPKEIEEIINLQAGRLTPYTRDEVIIDHIRIGVFRQSYTKLFLVIINKEVVQRQLALFAEAGVIVRRILLSCEALGHLVYHHLRLELREAPYAIIHVDSTSTEFGVFLKDKLIFLRGISIGAHQLLSEREKHLSRFIEELKKSFEAYHAEDIEASPSVGVFTGAVGKLRDLEVMMLDAFRLPIKILAPGEVVSRHDYVALETLDPPEVSMLSVAAASLGGQESGVNLIPAEMKLRRALEERGRDIIKAGAWVMTAFLFLAGIFLVNIYLKADYLKRLTEKYDPLKAQAAEVEEAFNRVRTIKKQLARRGESLDALVQLYERTPIDVGLTNIRLREDGSFTIRGEADSMSAVFGYLSGLEESKAFKGVKTKYTSKKKVQGQEIVDFEIGCTREEGGAGS